MSCHRIYYLICDQCGREYQSPDGECHGETREEIRGLAADDGWLCHALVENGSRWDFCKRCRMGKE